MNQAAQGFHFDQARFNMIEQQIRPWQVLDARVLDLLSQVRREDFAPQALRICAFNDMELPLGSEPGECMLAPRVEARMLQELDLQSHETVLEIGTGSGYMAALLSRLAARVVSLEINPALAAQAQTKLQQAGAHNVQVQHADATAHGFAACASHAPYDAIVISGSVAEVPPALLDALKVGGRLLAIVGDAPMMRATLIRRSGSAHFRTEQPWDVVAPRMRHFAEPSRFQF